MKFLIMSILSTFLLVSCAHSNKKMQGHNCQKSCSMHGEKGEAFNKHCAMAISKGNMKVKGSMDYKIVHNGETFYFASQEAMDEFNKDKESNIAKARGFWVVPSQEF